MDNATLWLGQAETCLTFIPAKSVQLIVCSPPYNMGKEYEKNIPIEEYIESYKSTASQLHHILSDTGSICWQVGNYVKKGEIIPLDILYYPIFQSLGMKLRNRIIWTYGHGLHASKRYSGRYETILWFTKSDNYIFNLDAVRVPSKYPNKKYFKGPRKGELSGNPLGKNPSDVWEIPNVKNNHPEKTEHPCQFPIELVERLVLALTDENDTVLDPYVGVGSSVLAALLHNRKAIGIDKENNYLKIALKRIETLKNGTIKRRIMGTPIYAAREK